MSTLNSTVDRPDILAAGMRLLQGIGWHGMGDCDFIVDPRDGVPKLMEVNPRFTRSIKILVAAGLEFPYLLYRLALGLPVEPQFEYRKGLGTRAISLAIACGSCGHRSAGGHGRAFSGWRAAICAMRSAPGPIPGRRWPSCCGMWRLLNPR